MTHPADNLKRRLDYILVNANMQPELINGSSKVPMLLPAEQMRVISDHLPVVADFVTENRNQAI
jgi:endonuclease/exonuclease/phosphatase family metal-dependent hydrolase